MILYVKQQNSFNKTWTMSTPVTLSLVWLPATRGAAILISRFLLCVLRTSVVTLIQGLITILLQVLLMPVAEHRSCVFCLFFGQAKAGTKRARGPHGTVFARLKNMKKRAPVLPSIRSGLHSVLTVHSLCIVHSGHLRWSKSESSVCHPRS